MIWCHKTNDFEKRHVGATLCGRPSETSQLIEHWLLEIENRFDGVTLDSYVIMSDHIHAIFVVLRKSPVAGDHTGSPLPGLANIDLGDIVGWFKTLTTNAYIQGVKQGIYQPFDSRLWQRNYYEHIVRDEDDLYEIRRYISENPARWMMDGKKPF